MTFGILGSGSWATALAKILCEQNDPLFWYLRNENTIAHLQQKGSNPSYLQNVSFNPNQLKLSSNMREIVKQSDILILAIPSPFLHQSLQEVKDLLPSKIVFSAVKGIVPESKDVVGKHLHHAFGVPKDQIGVIMGPCHAEEVALEKLSYLTLASQNQDTANSLAQQMTCSYIRTKISDGNPVLDQLLGYATAHRDHHRFRQQSFDHYLHPYAERAWHKCDVLSFSDCLRQPIGDAFHSVPGLDWHGPVAA